MIELLDELGIRTAVCVAVSGGAWNAAALAVGSQRRLRYYWRAFSRMPHVDLRNLLREHSPFNYAAMHRRTFRRYVDPQRLKESSALRFSSVLRDFGTSLRRYFAQMRLMILSV